MGGLGRWLNSWLTLTPSRGAEEVEGGHAESAIAGVRDCVDEGTFGGACGAEFAVEMYDVVAKAFAVLGGDEANISRAGGFLRVFAIASDMFFGGHRFWYQVCLSVVRMGDAVGWHGAGCGVCC